MRNLQDNSNQGIEGWKIEGWKNVEKDVSVNKHSYKNIEILNTKSVELENQKSHKVYQEVENTHSSLFQSDGLLLKNIKMKETR